MLGYQPYEVCLKLKLSFIWRYFFDGMRQKFYLIYCLKANTVAPLTTTVPIMHLHLAMNWYVLLFNKLQNLLHQKTSGNRQECLNIDSKCALECSSSAPFKMCYSQKTTVSEVCLFACSSFSGSLVLCGD